MIAALLLSLALAAEPRPPPPKPEPEPAEEKAPPVRAGADRDLPPLSAEDRAVIEHLELLEGMELLEDLPIVDLADEE